FANVDTDFNLQNITAAGKSIGLDLSATGTNNHAVSPTDPIPVLGGGNGDTLIGTAGVDVLTGNRGNDTSTGGAGHEGLLGGRGIDTVDYSAESGTNGVSVNLTTGSATDTFGNTDTLTSIENAIGTSHADSFTTNTAAGAGVDTFTGGAGDDTYTVKSGDI